MSETEQLKSRIDSSGMKPKIGSEIRYTEKGAPVGKTSGDVAGVVVSHSAMNICNFRNNKGDIDSFIWCFTNGLNTYFEWDGKDDSLPSAFFR